MSVHEKYGIRANYHLHTENSYCCEDITTERLAGFLPDWPYPLAITDHSAHLALDPEMRGKFGTDEAPTLVAACQDRARARFRRYLDKVRSLGSERVLAGTELDILPDGRPVFPEEMLGELDVIVGAVHSLAAVRHERPAAEIMREWRFQNRALMRLGADILAHPFRYLVQRKVSIPDGEVERLVEDAAHYGVALELNSHYLCPDLDRQMVRRCLEREVRIAVGTDAHRWGEITDFHYHEETLAACGITTPEQYEEVLFRHRRK